MNEILDLFEAIKSCDIGKVKELIRENPSLLKCKSQSGESPVLLAKYYGHAEIIDFFLSKNINLTIFESAALGKSDTILFLLRHDPQLLQAMSHDGFTPLHLAVFFGHSALVELLLQKGAPVNVHSKNTLHVTPLHSAVAGRRLEIAKMLLTNNADTNAQQQGGHTPLHGAAFNGHLEMVELLIRNGAQISSINDEGKTPLKIAKEMAHIDVMQYLRKLGAV